VWCKRTSPYAGWDSTICTSTFGFWETLLSGQRASTPRSARFSERYFRVLISHREELSISVYRSLVYAGEQTIYIKMKILIVESKYVEKREWLSNYRYSLPCSKRWNPWLDSITGHQTGAWDGLHLLEATEIFRVAAFPRNAVLCSGKLHTTTCSSVQSSKRCAAGLA